jgi:RHS repeat-associated protein
VRRFLLSLASLLVLITANASAQGKDGGGITPMCVSGCLGGIMVTPDGTPVEVLGNTSGYVAEFVVKNTGSSYASATLTCSTSGPLTCTGISQGSVSLDPNEELDISVTYSAGGGGYGEVGLSSGTDYGWYNVTVQAVGPPVVSLRNQNGDNLDRGLCLTSGAGESAAMQCGDLLVAHGTPAYATMGRERSLSLIYTSAQAVPRPLVAATVSQPIGTLTPTTVLAELKVNSGSGYVTKSSASYTGWANVGARTRQIALAYTDTTSASGIYPFQLTVTNQFPAPFATTVSGTVILVNRAGSRFGRGWSLAGVEELKFNQPVGTSTGDILWIGGDGSAKRYTKLNSTTWVAPPGAFRDTLVYSSTAQTYTRTLRHGIQVVYDNQGRHLRTVNRTLQSTEFGWNGSGQLATIRVPPKITSGVTYTIAYKANGDFDKITDPAGRVTDATLTTGRLTSIVDPDTSVATVFTYDAAGRMKTRVNRRGYTTKYNYLNATRLSSVIAPGTLAAGDTTVFQPWDEVGLATGPTGQTAIDTASVFTTILGPRVGVADNATIWIDRWGAPIKITNALGQTTTLTRGDAANPALVTLVTQPDGRVAKMTYNARGNLTESRDSTTVLNGLPTAVTLWAYASANTKDAPSSTTDPEGVVSQFQYNSWGLTSLVIAPNGHRTAFDYKPAGSADSLYGLLRAVIDSNVASYDSASGSEVNRHPRVAFSFNAKGNVTSDTSAMGRIRTMTRDARQLVTDVYDGAGYHTEFTHNQINLVILSKAHVEQAGISSTLYPADSGATAPLITTRYYKFGFLDSIVDPRGVKQRFSYDGANRLVTETDALGAIQRTWYNAAGQVDSVQQRTGGMIRNTYDAGGLLRKTQWDARQAAADSVSYTYDAGNRMLTATLGSGRTVTRTYFTNGLLKTEVQTGPSKFRHAYTYDRAGKRLTYVVGKPADVTANDSTSYRYSATTGLLQRLHVRWRKPPGLNDPIPVDSVRFAWDALGRRDTVAFTNGAIIRFAYDPDGDLRVLCSEHPGNLEGDSLRYSMHKRWVDQGGRTRRLDKVGHSLCPTVGVGVGGVASTFRYDAQGQVLLDSADGPGRWKFRYDASGNMVRRERIDQADLNLYTIQGGTNQLSVHFRNGQLRAMIAYDPDGARSNECSEIQYDASNRWILMNCAVEPGYREYHYDGLGRTVGTAEWVCTAIDENGWSCGAWGGIGATMVNCSYDPVGRLGRSCSGWELGYDGQNVARTINDSTSSGWTFVHGLGTDDPLVGYSTAGGGTHAYFITDGSGRQFAVTERDGTNLRGGGATPDAHQTAYQNFGGDLGGGTGASLGFGAERFESSAQPGLSFFRNRVYDQATGRWTQEDPIGIAGGLNLYQFNGNNPVTYTDPFGLCPPELTGRPCGNILGGTDMVLRGDISSGFGKASDRLAGIHQGADYLAEVGTTVTAADKGVVSRVGYDKGGYGHFIQLAHKDDAGRIVSYTFYGHLNKAPSLAGGAAVAAGDAIGVSGQSGNAGGTPPHVHFEIRTRSFPGHGLGNRCDPVKANAGESGAC